MKIKIALAKTISYRLLGTISSYFIAYFITGSAALGLTFAAADLVTKMLLYFLHEILWQWIDKK
jgi:uncharacterized membrane protein